jgi:hypothetical protein
MVVVIQVIYRILTSAKRIQVGHNHFAFNLSKKQFFGPFIPKMWGPLSPIQSLLISHPILSLGAHNSGPKIGLMNIWA